MNQVSAGAREIVFRPVQTLKPYERNARLHSEKQIEKLRQSIRRFKFCNPILIDRDGMILAGHGRFEAARREGLAEIPCVVLDHLSPEEARGYILADNRLAEESEWDQDLLRIEMADLEALDFDLPDLTGFTEKEVKKILYVGAENDDKNASENNALKPEGGVNPFQARVISGFLGRTA